MTKPTKQPTLTPSWKLLPQSLQLVRDYFVPLLYVLILPSLLTTLGAMLTNNFKNLSSTSSGFGLVVTLLGSLAAFLTLPAYIYLSLQATQHAEVTVPQIFKHSLRFLPRLFGLFLVYGVLLFLGCLLLIVPGLIILQRYYLAPYYLVDSDLSIREAMRRSAAESKPVSGYVWGVLGVTVILGIAGSICSAVAGPVGFFVGVLLGYTYTMAPALRYREIRRGLHAPLRREWSTVEH